MSGEYYRADILARTGLPVDLPVLASAMPGEQILVYRRRHDPRFSDVLRELDLQDDPERRAKAVAAERRLNERLYDVYLRTLHPVTPEQVAGEPIHRLFHERLIDPETKAFPGGRLRSFYVGQPVRFPGATLSWEAFAAARMRINGILYRDTAGELFRAAHDRLDPRNLADAGGVTAHGDAHNANVWFSERDGSASLSFFDPAFAGEHVPALLAEVKPTFHNILAHPFWLYDPDLAAQRLDARATLKDGILDVSMDWTPGPVRRELLDVKASAMWKPLLRELAERSMLPADWRRVIRLALFLCPTLVMNLRADAATQNPVSSLTGFAVAVMAGSEPAHGADFMTEFFDAVDPHRG